MKQYRARGFYIPTGKESWITKVWRATKEEAEDVPVTPQLAAPVDVAVTVVQSAPTVPAVSTVPTVPAGNQPEQNESARRPGRPRKAADIIPTVTAAPADQAPAEETESAPAPDLTVPDGVENVNLFD